MSYGQPNTYLVVTPLFFYKESHNSDAFEAVVFFRYKRSLDENGIVEYIGIVTFIWVESLLNHFFLVF